MKGKLTKRRYKCAMIFVDYCSHLRFIHLQINNSSVEALTPKCAFDTFTAKHGVRIQHYHCNNGRFYDIAFKQACHDARQQLTFCGVNVHFQNGIAERSIHASRARLLAAGSALFPMAICPVQHRSPPQQPASAVGRHIEARAFQLNLCWQQYEACAQFWLPSVCIAKRTSARQIFATMIISRTHWAQSRTKPNARNLYLVLILITGRVSPQYHCRFDDFFETTCHGGPDVSGTICWQQIAGLDCVNVILSEMSAPIQCSIMNPETPSEEDVPPEELPFSPPVFDVTSDDYSVSDGDLKVSENTKPSR